PPASDLDICLIGEPPVTGSMPAEPRGPDEPGSEPLHPAIDGDVVNGDTAPGQQFPDITAGQTVAQVPAGRDRDHLPRKPRTSKRGVRTRGGSLPQSPAPTITQRNTAPPRRRGSLRSSRIAAAERGLAGLRPTNTQRSRARTAST